jgi:Cyclopropane fatty acid synthase and related methyltransferases
MENVVMSIARTALTYVSSITHSEQKLADQVRSMAEKSLRTLPWRVELQDWTGRCYSVGGKEKHWSGLESLRIHLKTSAAGRDLLALDAMRFLERFLDGEVDMEGNLYLFPEIRNYAKFGLQPWQLIWNRAQNLVMQDTSRASKSVKSHYDIPQAALYYLDQDTRSYSCAIWERPHDMSLKDVLTVGQGKNDKFDSLERAQYRKFRHAADFLAPGPRETVLDVGCGYPGFIRTLFETYRPAKAVGWTHSANQVREGKKMLKHLDPGKYELNEGDYRLEERVYDHIHSTGMICHVGPEGKDSGLRNYVRQVRRRIKLGGRYVHHCMMTPYTRKPLFDQIGPAFNRKYVWPGFYYYSLGEHLNALEQNGFHVVAIFDLSPHYAKTTRAWYERMMQKKGSFIAHTNESTFRAWQVYLAGATAAHLNGGIDTYRIFCEARDKEKPSIRASDPARNVAARRTIVI